MENPNEDDGSGNGCGNNAVPTAARPSQGTTTIAIICCDNHEDNHHEEDKDRRKPTTTTCQGRIRSFILLALPPSSPRSIRNWKHLLLLVSSCLVVMAISILSSSSSSPSNTTRLFPKKWDDVSSSESIMVHHEEENSSSASFASSSSPFSCTSLLDVESNCAAMTPEEGIPNDSLLLLHVGKSGGGTIIFRYEYIWNIFGDANFANNMPLNNPATITTMTTTTSNSNKKKKKMQLLQQCHPNPCPDTKFQSMNELLLNHHYGQQQQQQQQLEQQQQQQQKDQSVSSSTPTTAAKIHIPRVILTIRDPVDRFVSAFYWKHNMYCKVNNNRSDVIDDIDDDTRVMLPITKRNFYLVEDDVTKYCLQGTQSQNKLYFLQEYYEHYDYNNNNGTDTSTTTTTTTTASTSSTPTETDLSLLAEALCEDHPLYEQAKRDVRQIEHMRYELEEWMPWSTKYLPNDNNEKTTANTLEEEDEDDANALQTQQQRQQQQQQSQLLLQYIWMKKYVTPVVLEEPGFDFNEQMDLAMNWVLKKNSRIKKSIFQQRRQKQIHNNNDTGTDIDRIDKHFYEDWIQSRQQYVHCQDCYGVNNNPNLQSLMKFQTHTSQKRTSNYPEVQEKSTPPPTTTTSKQQQDKQSQSQQQQRSYPKLSQRGEYCAIQYFRSDYEVLKLLLSFSIPSEEAAESSAVDDGVEEESVKVEVAAAAAATTAETTPTTKTTTITACKFEKCREALQSILLRRKHQLEQI